MKKIIFVPLTFLCFFTLQAQSDISGTNTATLKSSTRLFKDKNDLTSVIRIIQSGSVVDVIDP